MVAGILSGAIHRNADRAQVLVSALFDESFRGRQVMGESDDQLTPGE